MAETSRPSRRRSAPDGRRRPGSRPAPPRSRGTRVANTTVTDRGTTSSCCSRCCRWATEQVDDAASQRRALRFTRPTCHSDLGELRWTEILMILLFPGLSTLFTYEASALPAASPGRSVGLAPPPRRHPDDPLRSPARSSQPAADLDIVTAGHLLGIGHGRADRQGPDHDSSDAATHYPKISECSTRSSPTRKDTPSASTSGDALYGLATQRMARRSRTARKRCAQCARGHGHTHPLQAASKPAT